MVNSKQRKIVTIVCIVLGVLLIAGGIIGTLLYLNSNEYRFRMNAFVDKYKNAGETSFGNNLIWIRIYQGDDIYTKDFIVAKVKKTDDGTKLHYLDGATSKEISPEQVDANVRKRVEYLAGIFGTNCEVKKDRIIFDTKELSITKTEYLPPNIMEVSPRRIVYATDAVGKYEISHADRPGGGREYGRIDINVGIKIVNTEGQNGTDCGTRRKRCDRKKCIRARGKVIL